MKNKISLMFSGGVDSTYAAVQMARQYDEVRLLTFHNEYGHYRIGRTAKRCAELKSLFSGRVFHEIISTRTLFERIVVDPLQDDLEKYGSGFVWCMGCKLAMHAMQIAYDIEHEIQEAADGSSADTSEMVEQTLISISMLTYLYEDYGIAFAPVAYDEPRRSKIAELEHLKLRLGLRIGDRFLGLQPKCKPGEIYYLPYLLLHQPPKHEEQNVGRYIREKSGLVREFLAGRGIQPVKDGIHAMLRR